MSPDEILDALFGASRRPPPAPAKTYPPGPLATERQIARLEEWSYPYDAARLTVEEARDVIFRAKTWGDDNPVDFHDMFSMDDIWEDGDAPRPTFEDRRDMAIRRLFRWPLPQYKRDEREAKRREGQEFRAGSLAERIATRRSQGPARLATYVKTRLSQADDGLRAAIQALLTEEEWRAAMTDPARHQTDPS